MKRRSFLFREARRYVYRELAIDAVMNLKARLSQTLLSLSGIAVGTAAVIVMLHVGHNARKVALEQFERVGLDCIKVNISQQQKRQLTLSDAEALVDASGLVRAIAPLLQISVSIQASALRREALVIGSTPPIAPLAGLVLAGGRFISEFDSQQLYAVLGAELASELALAKGRPVTVGDRIWAGDAVLVVIGWLAPVAANPVFGLDFDGSIIVPFQAARRIVPTAVLSQIAGKLGDPKLAAMAIEHIKSELASRLNTSEISVVVAQQMIASVEAQMRIYSALLVAIGSVALVVGGIGIMNVLLMSVMERRHEIGLRRAIGATASEIGFIFLVEALLLAAVGAFLGLGIGIVVARLFALAQGWSFEIAPLAIPLGSGLALVVGLGFGLYPAMHAASLNPIEALRAD